MHGTVVGVLRGGPSAEHEISLKSGHTALSHLPRDRYTVRDIYIDRQGVWHDRGIPVTPGKILPLIDVAIVMIHGPYGQDGTVQKILEQFSVPYTGADSFHAFHASHKVLAKERARESGIRTPRYVFTETAEKADVVAREAVRSFHPPVVIKPVGSGSSIGISLVTGFKPIADAVRELFEGGASGVLIEERIRGTEATVGIVEGLRGEELYALPAIEIVPSEEHGWFSYDAKYSGETQELCPGRFPRAVADELTEAARTMHRQLGQRHYSRSDFIVSDKGVYFLELNSATDIGMTTESLMPKSLAAVGVKLPDFFTHLVDLARK
ncbi:MAG TPA: ATP-grasp domain-containing protein [Candidatus Paceibacterota bacterium]|jgi:D-alanine-D-alanine ligase